MSKKISLGKYYRRTFAAIILLSLVNYVLLRWMDGSNAFGVLTASGKNTPVVTTVAAMAMIGLRMYLYLIVPGMAAARLGSATLRWYADRDLEAQEAPVEQRKPAQPVVRTWALPWSQAKPKA